MLELITTTLAIPLVVTIIVAVSLGSRGGKMMWYLRRSMLLLWSHLRKMFE